MNGLTRKLAIALAVSAALNLFALGFMAARHMGRRGRGRPAIAAEPGPEVRALWAPHRERLRPVHDAVRRARRQVRQALTADPFDRSALEGALSDLREATGAGQAAFHAALVEMAAETDAIGRRRLAHSPQLWRDGPGPRARGMGGGPGGPGGPGRPGRP